MRRRIDQLETRPSSVAPPTPSIAATTPQLSATGSSGSHAGCEGKLKEVWECTKERLDSNKAAVERVQRQLDSDLKSTTDLVTRFKADIEDSVAKLRTDVRVAESNASVAVEKARALEAKIDLANSSIKQLAVRDASEEGEIEEEEDESKGRGREVSPMVQD